MLQLQETINVIKYSLGSYLKSHPLIYFNGTGLPTKDKTLRRTGRLNMASMWFMNDRMAIRLQCGL